ncbi:MAG: oligogalacturonate lyase family protein [Collinsella sp.]|nr:oligogalacturonate lyase family protein [Collinsella sp.]
MAVGDVFHNEFESFVDPDTGAHLERLTPRGAVCHHMRFNQRHITRDSMFLLYSMERNGVRRICALNLESGQSVQLTNGRDVADYTGVLSANDQYMYYLQSNAVYRISLLTLLRERVYAAPRPWCIRAFTVSETGEHLAVTETEGTRLPTHLESSDWVAFSLSVLAPPTSRIVYVDVASGAAQTVIEQDSWIGQAQIRPRDERTILFCHEGPYDAIDARIWLVQTDGSGLRSFAKRRDQIMTQEFWWPDGSRVGYYFADAGPDGASSLRTVDPDSGEEHTVAQCSPYVHCMCGCTGRFIVGDSSGSWVPMHELERDDGLDLPKEAPGARAGDYIYLVDVARQREFRLCHHGSTWSLKYGTTQDAHPHPYLSDDGRWVFFTSDREGKPAVYRVDAARFCWENLGREPEVPGPVLPGLWGLASTFEEEGA